jgi:cobalt/nickel transport system permease protein
MSAQFHSLLHLQRIIMHIPDMMLQGTVCPVTAALAAAGLAGTAYAAYKTKIKPAASYFAGVTALIFAAQMANFPIQLGTSGHLLGATLAVALLGSAFGIFAMTLVVITQCLVFADGGVSALGANLLNMALLASLPAILVREFYTSTSFKKTAYFAAAFVSTIIAAAACAIELAATGVAPIQSVLPAMLSVHALIGLAEAGLTVAALALLTQAVTRVAPHRAWLVPLGCAAAIALVIAPFAAASPDGLESVAAALGFLQHAGCTCASGSCLLHAFVPFAGYAVPGVSSAVLSTALAGFVGVMLLSAVAYGTGRVLARNQKQ